MEFLLGDEALKALPLSEKLAKAAKTAKAIESSPTLSRVVSAGIRAVRGGVVGAAQGAVRSGGNGSSALTEGCGGRCG